MLGRILDRKAAQHSEAQHQRRSGRHGCRHLTAFDRRLTRERDRTARDPLAQPRVRAVLTRARRVSRLPSSIALQLRMRTMAPRTSVARWQRRAIQTRFLPLAGVLLIVLAACFGGTTDAS